VFTAYFVAATATVAMAGKLADLFGRRSVFLGSIGLFLIGSLLCGLADSMLWLVVFRAVQGIGAGGISTCSFIVMGDMFTPRERGKWQGINAIGFATASAIGPSLGGVLSDTLSWRWIFLLNVPVCLAILATLVYGLVDAPRARSRPSVDFFGATASMLAIVAILLALTWGGREYAWLSPPIVGLLVLAGASATLLWWAERRASDPFIPAALLRDNVVRFACLGHFTGFFVWFSMILLAPVRLQLVHGATATEAGALLTPGIVLSPAGAILAGQIASRTGRCRPLCLFGGGLQVIGLAMLLYVPREFPQLWVLVSFSVVGVGTGFAVPSFMLAFQNAVPPRRFGAAIGMLSLFRQFGSSVGTALVGAIVGSATLTAVALAGSIQDAVLVQLVAGVGVLAASWLMSDQPLAATRTQAAPQQRTEAIRPVG
jgi:EmrB/QacA subfamily drug resistance transporter